MKIYDISQEVFTCEVYPGDKAPQITDEMRMSRGDLYNLSSFEMCAHNGTHIDAPFHFFEDGKTVEDLPLYKTVGACYVTLQDFDINAECAKNILLCAAKAQSGAENRILIKGKGVISADAAQVFADKGVYLLGVEGQTVGPQAEPMQVHKILLGAEVILLEGIRLTDVDEGVYFICAAPLSLKGSDGAPCRAVLIADA